MRSMTLTRVAVIMNGMETTIRNVRDITLLFGRVTLGIVFIAHGWTRRTNGIESTATRFESWSVPAPTVSAYFATYLELIGGSALIVGLMTPVVAVQGAQCPLLAAMSSADSPHSAVLAGS
jgi:uncharacterized membrane protein YphA (DoxX/SURF4 family)